MSTIVNNPGTPVVEDSSSNLVIGVILTIVILGGLALFFVYGLPMIQNNQNPNPANTNINVTLPNRPAPVPPPAPAPIMPPR